MVKPTSLEIRDGELFVLLGASGSGKSTILRMVAGLTLPDSGRIWLHERDVTHLPPQARGIGLVFQNYSIFRHMSVGENIEFPLKIRKVPPPERARRREELLDRVGLGGFGNRYAHQLSGGQQQRVALARALVHEPSVLLLDEPFGALDVKIRSQLRRNLREIQRQLGVTAILVTHDQEEAFELADRIGVMERGELLEVGEPETLYARPHTLFGATFLGAGTVLVGRARDGAAQIGPLALPIPPEVEHEEDERVRVLVRPEQVTISAGPPERGVRLLGQGTISSAISWARYGGSGCGMPAIPGTRQAAPAVYGEEGLLVDAVLPAEADVSGPDVWVSLRGWHILAPPQPRLLVCDLPDQGSPAPFPFVRALQGPLGAKACLLAVTDDANGVEPLRASLAERAAAAGPARRRAGGAARRSGRGGRRRAAAEPLRLRSSSIRGRSGDPPGLLDGLATPLLVVQGEPATFSRILICTAVGEPGKADVRVGGWLARRLGAEVTLLHVLPEGPGRLPG